MGGPLLAIPVSALAAWGGCTQEGTILGGTGTSDDYDRACAVNGLAGTIAVGTEGSEVLVLADEPATTCYLPEHRVFLRWLAADAESDLLEAAEYALADPCTTWDDCGTWNTDGPAVLMDSAEAGADLGVAYPDGGFPEEAPVPLPNGTWTIRAVHTEFERGWVGLVQLLPIGN